MSKLFSQTPSTLTDSIGFSSLVIAGLLTLALGSWSPLPKVKGTEAAPSVAQTNTYLSAAAPAQKNVRG